MKKRENNFFLNLGQFVSNLIVLERSQRASEKIKTDQHEDEGWKTVTHVCLQHGMISNILIQSILS